MKRILLICLAVMIVVALAEAQEISRLQPNKINNLNYDPNTDNQTSVTASIKIKKATVDTIYALSIETGALGRTLSGSDPSYPLYFEVYDSAYQPPRIIPSWSQGIYPDDFPRGFFPAGSKNVTNDHPLIVSILPGSVVPAGTYSGSFDLSLWGGHSGLYPQYIAISTFTITVKVAQRTEMTLVQVDAPFNTGTISETVDFGELFETDYRELDLVVRSNISYSVSVTSTNGAALKHPDSQEIISIPYVFTLEGQPITLSPGISSPLVTNAPWTIAGEDRYTLRFTIGAFDNPAAGEYSDTLTFTISAN